MNKMSGLLCVGLVGSLLGSAFGQEVKPDRYDPKDDTKDGKPTVLSVSSRQKRTERTLTKSDSADWFTIKVKEGVYYRFDIPKKTGDAVFDLELIDDAYTSLNDTGFLRADQAGTWYLKVRHASSSSSKWKDGTYTLSAVSINPGTISFAKNEIKVKENAPYAELTVKRSSKEGAVQVRYNTAQVTASPGEDYYQTTGVLQWPDGDNKAKKIRIPLIPDFRPTYEGEDKSFTVYLSKVDNPLFEYEFPAVFKGWQHAVVTLQEVDKPNPGTVAAYSVTEDPPEDDEEWKWSENRFKNPKKPEMTLTSGSEKKIWFTREGGSDGEISILVTTSKGKALPGTHYKEINQTISWGDGDQEPKYLMVRTFDTPYLPHASFTIKMKDATEKGKPRPKLFNSSVTVNVVNRDEKSTLAEWSDQWKNDKYHKHTVKESKKESWYLTGEEGKTLSTAMLTEKFPKAELTFSLEGPGVFCMWPVPNNNVTVTVKLGKEERTLGNKSPELFFAQAGRQTLKISVVRKSGTPEFQFDYDWCKAGEIIPSVPAVDNAVVLPGPMEFNYAWDFDITTVPDVYDDYKVYCTEASNKRALGTPDTLVPMGDWAFVKDLKPGEKYVWQVEATLYENDVAKIVTKNKKPWTITVAESDQVLKTDIYGEDIWGPDINYSDEYRLAEVHLMQGVQMAAGVCADNTLSDKLSYSVVGGKLPPGVKLEKDGALSGTPTKPGHYEVLCQVTDNSTKTKGLTLTLRIDVEKIDKAKGNYLGLLKQLNSVTKGAYQMASMSFTASEQGRLTAKVTIGGKNYSFKSSGFDTIEVLETSEGYTEEMLSTEMTSIQKIGKNSYQNTLKVNICNWHDFDWEHDEILTNYGKVDLAITVPGLDGEPINLHYVGFLHQDNTARKEVEARLMQFVEPLVGYYTTHLCPVTSEYPEEIKKGVPLGYGYLTFTIDPKGKTKYSGLLADGTKFSGSSSIYQPNFWENEEAEWFLPIFIAKKDYLLAKKISFWGQCTYANPEDGLVWNNDDPASTYWEGGYRLVLQPLGGKYDDLVNLQTYYLQEGFPLSIETEDLGNIGSLYPEITPDNYGLINFLGMNGFNDFAVIGNQFEVPKRKLVKEKGAGYDWNECVNPQNFSIKLNRATGITTGGFSIWTEDETSKRQKEIRVKHQGVLVHYPYDSEYCDFRTRGFFTIPMKIKNGKKTRTWNASFPIGVGVK